MLSGGLRGPLIFAELVALGAVLALVEDTAARVALGLIVGLLLARAALGASPEVRHDGPPEGFDDRRRDHLYRHWVNALIKKIREFHAVCQGLRQQSVHPSLAQMKVQKIEKELQNLVVQVADTAKPEALRTAERRRGAAGKLGGKDAAYGEPRKDDFDYD